MKANQHTLAIVIPAYKAKYITDTLSSLAAQTCKSFKVYIGNDGGDSEIDDIVKSFESELDLTYVYFDKNLGSTSLVKAWQRCIALTNNEPWIWLLPDDDYVNERCVEGVLEEILKNSRHELIRFNSTLVNEKGHVIKKNPPFPEVEAAFVSLMEKINYNRTSTLAEYVFSRKTFVKTGGFPELPLAWGSDDAAWYLFGQKAGIRTTCKGEVFIRQSKLNISNNYSDYSFNKLEALLNLFCTLKKKPAFESDILIYSEHYNFEKDTQFFVFNEMRELKLSLSIYDIFYLGSIASRVWSGGKLKNSYRFWLNNYRNKKYK
ncbi:glycosyltransferase family 2 protein [Pontibacter sp. CAU 1760]